MARFFKSKYDDQTTFNANVLYYKKKLRFEIFKSSFSSARQNTEVREENLIHKVANLVDLIVEVVEERTRKKIFKAKIEFIPDEYDRFVLLDIVGLKLIPANLLSKLST